MKISNYLNDFTLKRFAIYGFRKMVLLVRVRKFSSKLNYGLLGFLKICAMYEKFYNNVDKITNAVYRAYNIN